MTDLSARKVDAHKVDAHKLDVHKVDAHKADAHKVDVHKVDVQDGDVLAALRAATAARHTVLDTGLPLAGEAPTLDDYRDHLLMLRAWLAPMERWLEGFNDGPQTLPPVARTATIDADLALIDPALTLPEDPVSWPPQASADYRWGVAYVVEGSQLGGAVLYKRLADRLAPHPLGYLRSEAGPGPRWRAFVDALRAAVQSPGAVAEACQGACDAFDRLIASSPH
jgi:heme oxygenase